MSTPWILHRLYSLDSRSLFLRHLYSLIRHDEEERYLPGLQGPELARLVDSLDEVRDFPSSFCPVTKRALQTLSTTSTNDEVSRQCLRKLRAICGHHATLPSSCIISDEIARVGDSPIALGVITDVWEGTHRGKRVYIKPLKVSLNNDQTLKKVRVRCSMSSSRLPKNAYGPCSHSSKTPLCGKD